MRAPFAALVLLALASVAQAHGVQHTIDEQLIEDGEKLMVGTFTAAQAGPLVVVPYTNGPLPCGATPDDYRLPLGPAAGVMFAANETMVQALFDVDPYDPAYVGFAVDTHDASRSLLLMQENVVALHALLAYVRADNGPGTFRTGALGLPYPVAGSGHDFNHTPEGGGILMDHDGSFLAGERCQEPDGPVVLRLNRSDLPDSLAVGRIVHVVALFDPVVAAFAPRPSDGTSEVLQANLYLARAGEDPAQVREAFAPSRWRDALPLLVLAGGLVWIARR